MPTLEWLMGKYGPLVLAAAVGVAVGYWLGARGAIRATIFGMLQEDNSPRLSMNRTLAFIGGLALVSGFLRAIWMSAQTLTVDLMLGLGGAISLVAGGALTSKYLATRPGAMPPVGGPGPDPPQPAPLALPGAPGRTP